MNTVKSVILAASIAFGLAAGAASVGAQDQDDDPEYGMGMYGPGMGPGMMHRRGWGRHMMRGLGGRRWHMRMIELADTNENGRVSAEEATAFWTKQMETYDADKDGAFSLDEFAEMHAAHTRPMMVDRFQDFDDDGDAKVTEEELQKPFERMRRFMGRWGDMPMGPGGMRGRMGDGPSAQ